MKVTFWFFFLKIWIGLNQIFGFWILFWFIFFMFFWIKAFSFSTIYVRTKDWTAQYRSVLFISLSFTLVVWIVSVSIFLQVFTNSKDFSLFAKRNKLTSKQLVPFHQITEQVLEILFCFIVWFVLFFAKKNVGNRNYEKYRVLTIFLCYSVHFVICRYWALPSNVKLKVEMFCPR